jgi:hypothetical protein
MTLLTAGVPEVSVHWLAPLRSQWFLLGLIDETTRTV